MTILVTGGGGFLGKAIVRLLVERGDSVRSVSRGDYPELRAMGVDTVRGDLSDASVASKAVAGCDLVFHVAAKAGVWATAANDLRRKSILRMRNHTTKGPLRSG